MVRSTPIVVNAKHAMNPPAEDIKGAGNKAAVASPNPNMAGSARDRFHLPYLVDPIDGNAATHIASAPQYRGMLE